MIDDDWTLDEGDIMPAAWWRLDGRVPLTVRCGPRRVIPGLPLLAWAVEFSGDVLSVAGPRYLNLHHFTRCNATRHWETTPQRAAFDALQHTHPDTFSTVIGRNGPTAVWLALRLTRLTDAIADTLAAVHDRTCPIRHHP